VRLQVAGLGLDGNANETLASGSDDCGGIASGDVDERVLERRIAHRYRPL